jgi:hypothetical protein
VDPAQRRLAFHHRCLTTPPAADPHGQQAVSRSFSSAASEAGDGGRTGAVAPFAWPAEEPLFGPYELDLEGLHRDGFAVLPGIMTEATRQRWKAACVDVQRINDRLLLETDWGSVDWAACGLEQPIERVSTADLEAASLGGCQLPVPAGVRPAGFSHYLHRDVPGMAFGWGGFPESHAVEHSEFLQFVCAHPEMLTLHSGLLGVDEAEIRFDHGLILNRKAGFAGQNWHSHSYQHEGAPGGDEQHDESAELGQSLVRTLCYPDGYAARDAGGLGLVPGSHRFRQYIRSIDMEEWIAGKTDADHRPLQIVREGLPPGSLVALLCHSAHSVSPVVQQQDDSEHPDGSTRWASLFCYR